MSVLPIVTYEDEVLLKETEPIQENSDELQQLIDNMFDTMYNANGVGLAAPQVGKLLRFFVADPTPMIEEMTGEKVPPEPLVLINPKITFESDETVTFEEGCLSIPEVRGPVKRPENVMVEFKDRNLNNQKREVDGVWARVIQHEIDHLDGVLFLDYLSLFKRKLLSNKLKKIANGTKPTDYPVVKK